MGKYGGLRNRCADNPYSMSRGTTRITCANSRRYIRSVHLTFRHHGGLVIGLTGRVPNLRMGGPRNTFCLFPGYDTCFNGGSKRHIVGGSSSFTVCLLRMNRITAMNKSTFNSPRYFHVDCTADSRGVMRTVGHVGRTLTHLGWGAIIRFRDVVLWGCRRHPVVKGITIFCSSNLLLVALSRARRDVFMLGLCLYDGSGVRRGGGSRRRDAYVSRTNRYEKTRERGRRDRLPSQSSQGSREGVQVPTKGRRQPFSDTRHPNRYRQWNYPCDGLWDQGQPFKQEAGRSREDSYRASPIRRLQLLCQCSTHTIRRQYPSFSPFTVLYRPFFCDRRVYRRAQYQHLFKVWGQVYNSRRTTDQDIRQFKARQPGKFLRRLRRLFYRNAVPAIRKVRPHVRFRRSRAQYRFRRRMQYQYRLRRQTLSYKD